MSTHGAEESLKRIISLCSTPHWTADRKVRIYDLATSALKDVQYYKKLSTVVRELDDEVEPGCTDE